MTEADGPRRPARRRRVAVLPTTPPGWWAVRLSAIGLMLALSVVVVPGLDGPDIIGTVLGIAGTVVGIVALVRAGERAVLVYLAALAPPAVAAVAVILVATAG